MKNNQEIKVRAVYNKKSVLAVLVLGVIVVVAAVLMSTLLKFDLVQNLVMAWVLTTLYAVLAFFLIESGIIREIHRTIYHEVEKPVEVKKERFHTIDNPIIQVVEKPVFKEVPVEKTKVVYKEKPRKKLNIPKYNFVGSSETKTYHKRTCRLGKLIKKKYKVSNNSEAYFKRKGFKPCKVCLKKSSKGKK